MTSLTFQSKLLAIQRNLLSFAITLTNNRDDAYDLVQDTTLKVLDSEDKYQETSNFKGWVFTIMRNLFINNYRKQVRSGVVMDNSEDQYMLTLAEDNATQTPEGAITATEIHRALESFSDDFRIPFSMHLQGYKYIEIAQEMNLPLGTVKSRIYFARQRLQQMLKVYAPA